MVPTPRPPHPPANTPEHNAVGNRGPSGGTVDGDTIDCGGVGGGGVDGGVDGGAVGGDMIHGHTIHGGGIGGGIGGDAIHGGGIGADAVGADAVGADAVDGDAIHGDTIHGGGIGADAVGADAVGGGVGDHGPGERGLDSGTVDGDAVDGGAVDGGAVDGGAVDGGAVGGGGVGGDGRFGVVAEVVRVEGARILATLIRTVGDVQLAEDAVQEAALAALKAWPVSGVPSEPRAWLTVTARRKAIDIIRREAARDAKERDGAALIELTRRDLDAEDVVQDDLLRLIFTCCHPSLSPPTRVALALRTLCGLSAQQIAAVLLTTEVATTKRLVRARQKIARARIPYRVPSESELPERLPAVCAVIHSLYTAGHAPAEGEAAYDVDLCTEAIRLADLLHSLLPAQPTATAVLALLMLTEARRPARLDETGAVVTLDLQDRSLWDRELIDRGIALLNTSLEQSGRQADAYQLQAAIAAEHARVPSYPATDWHEIVRLYDLLIEVSPSPAAELARVVAIAETGRLDTALTLLDGIPPNSRWHAVRGEILARQTRYDEAADELQRALDTAPTSHPERTHRERRRNHFRHLLDQPPNPPTQPTAPMNNPRTPRTARRHLGQAVGTLNRPRRPRTARGHLEQAVGTLNRPWRPRTARGHLEQAVGTLNKPRRPRTGRGDLGQAITCSGSPRTVQGPTDCPDPQRTVQGPHGMSKVPTGCPRSPRDVPGPRGLSRPPPNCPRSPRDVPGPRGLFGEPSRGCSESAVCPGPWRLTGTRDMHSSPEV